MNMTEVNLIKYCLKCEFLAKSGDPNLPLSETSFCSCNAWWRVQSDGTYIKLTKTLNEMRQQCYQKYEGVFNEYFEIPTICPYRLEMIVDTEADSGRVC